MKDKNLELCEQVELYVINGLSDEEQEEFEKHLTSCKHCQEQVQELRSIVDLIPLGSEPVELPSGMKERVLHNVSGETKHSDMAEQNVVQHKQELSSAEKTTLTDINKKRGKELDWRRMAISGLTAAVVLLSFYTVQLKQELSDLELQISQGETTLDQPMKLNEVVSLSPAGDLVAQGLATIIIDSKGTHLLVQAQDLPELKDTEAYQVWLLKDGQPFNAGTFLTEQGSGALYYTFEPSDYDQIAITLEPDAKGDQPRGNIVLAASLKTGS
jgi:hypothetical protein